MRRALALRCAALVVLLVAPLGAALGPAPGPGSAALGPLASQRTLFPLVARNQALTFRDDFANAASGWPISDDAVATRGYLDGQYRIVVKQAGFTVFAGRNLAATDPLVEVFARVTTSTPGAYGLYFGSVTAGLYLYQVRTGMFRLLRFGAGPGVWSVLIQPTASAALRSDTQGNVIAVGRTGGTIRLYANGQQVGQTTDSTFGRGTIGMSAEAYAPNYEVRFDDFVLDFGTAGAALSAQAGPSARGEAVEPKNAEAPGAEWPEGRG
jgi:hypothetical protein